MFLSTFRPLAGRTYWSILLHILNFSTFRPLTGSSNDWFYWLYYIFSTFRIFALGGMSNWLILPNIVNFYDFSTFRHGPGRSNCLILLNILNFSTFRLFDLLVGDQNDWFYLIYRGYYTKSPPLFLDDFRCRVQCHTTSPPPPPPPCLAQKYFHEIQEKTKNLNKHDITLSPPPFFLVENYCSPDITLSPPPLL